MLKGHVFSRQLFENQIYAACNNTFLNGWNGILDYKNKMAITYSGSNVTVDSGLAVIQGRPVEEDTSTTISAGTENMYCKLVIEIDLDQQNTESEFKQAFYKIIKSANSYPTLTQTNIVKNNAGVYQYELARFRTSANGISEFQDKRTFLDFDTIYDEIRQHIEDIDSSTFLGDLIFYKGILPENTDLNNLTETGLYYTVDTTLYNAGSDYAYCYIMVINFGYSLHQYLIKPISNIVFIREYSGNPSIWHEWKKLVTSDELENYLLKSGGTITGPLTIVRNSFDSLIHRRIINNSVYTSSMGVGDYENEGTTSVTLLDNNGQLKGKLDIRSDGKIYNGMTNSQLLEKGDIAVVTGAIQTDETGAGSCNLEYPAGYSKDNCMVLSLGIQSNQVSHNWVYDASGDNRSATLGTNSISVYFGLSGFSNKTAYIKLLLMKVS